MPVSMFCAGKGSEPLLFVHVVAGEDEIPVLDKTIAITPRPALRDRRTRRPAPGRSTAPSTVRRARCCPPGPRSWRCEAGRPYAPWAFPAQPTPPRPRYRRLDGIVALEVRDPQPLAIEPQVVQRELPGKADRSLLEVVAHREIAQHLEERAVAGCQPDLVDVGGPEAFLDAGKTPAGWLGQAHEVGLELLHARGGEQHRRILERHQGGAGHQQVPLLDEVVNVHLA